jgi:hypothetical protein
VDYDAKMKDRLRLVSGTTLTAGSAFISALDWIGRGLTLGAIGRLYMPSWTAPLIFIAGILLLFWYDHSKDKKPKLYSPDGTPITNGIGKQLAKQAILALIIGGVAAVVTGGIYYVYSTRFHTQVSIISASNAKAPADISVASFEGETCMAYDPTALFIKKNTELNASINDGKNDFPFRFVTVSETPKAFLAIARLYSSLCWTGDPVKARNSNNDTLIRWVGNVPEDKRGDTESAILATLDIQNANHLGQPGFLKGLRCFSFSVSVVTKDVEDGPFFLLLDRSRTFNVGTEIESKNLDRERSGASVFCTIGWNPTPDLAPISEEYAVNVIGFFYR